MVINMSESITAKEIIENYGPTVPLHPGQNTALQWPHLHTMNIVEEDATAPSICHVVHFLPQAANCPCRPQLWPATCACN